MPVLLWWLTACLVLYPVSRPPPPPHVVRARHMVSTLQALRGGSEVLLATMDVFLNEPVMDWTKEDTGRRQNKTKRGGEPLVFFAMICVRIMLLLARLRPVVHLTPCENAL